MDAQVPDNSASPPPSELERLERSLRYEFGYRQIIAWGICLFGCLFAVMSLGCIIQNFVDRYPIWNRDPVRGVLEPMSWAVASTLALLAGRSIFAKRYLRSVLLLSLIVAMFAIIGSIYG